MVWWVFLYRGAADLIIQSNGQNVTKDVYLLTDNHLGECSATTGVEVLQQDGAPCHIVKGVKHWFCTSEVECIPDLPCSSPDVPPIENLWAFVIDKLRGEDTSTVAKLEVALTRNFHLHYCLSQY